MTLEFSMDLATKNLGTTRSMARFALTVFMSAFLLFQVQPLIAKAILPWFGGGSSVWTTCMLFFQILLLAGYAYAHVLSVKLSPRRQGMVHLVLVIASLALLPIRPSQQFKPISSDSPVGGILLLLLASVGGPYFILSSTGPLMQRWFSRLFTGRSPYRLYSLSNFGSLLALLSYPFVFEPMLRLQQQVWIWSIAYGLFAALAVWCSLRVMKLGDEPLEGALQESHNESHNVPDNVPDKEPHSVPHREPLPGEVRDTTDDPSAVRPGFGRMLLWLGLATMGSTMLLATTNQMCIDVAVVPFLWVLPLSLYLLTFVICFDNPRWYDRRVYGLLLVPAAAVACWQLNRDLETSIPVLVSVYSAVMFVCCMSCHGELVDSRPHPRYLTLFYLLVAAGGALGGVLVAVVSPMVFTAFWEYHVALAGTCGVTLIAWCVNRVWQGRYSLVFWIWAAVSIVQIGLVIELVYRRHAESFTQEDVAWLFGVIGILQLIGWIVTADRERQPKALALIWTGVTLGQLVWVIGLTQTRFAGTVGANQSVVLCVASVLAAAVGFFVVRLLEKRSSETSRRWFFVVVLQALSAVGLFMLWYSEEISTETSIGLAASYLGLHVIGFLWSRRKSDTFVRGGMWFLAPTVTAWLLLVLQLNDLAGGNRSAYVYRSRNFYGVLGVAMESDINGDYHSLIHGQIEHGFQYIDEAGRRTPTTYYGEGTGVDLAMRLHPRRLADDLEARSLRVGIVGLGAGTVAAYGKPGDNFRFYEINRDVVGLSDKYFSYLKDSPANTEVVVGDARIAMDRELAAGQSQQFDVLVIDAFSSDSIPLHLLTRECSELYRQHLATDGLLLIHISNRFLDLNPITLALAEHLGWKAVRIESEDQDELGVYGATWIIITANEEFLSHDEVRATHSPWAEDQPLLLWTDDFASLWQVISY